MPSFKDGDDHVRWTKAASSPEYKDAVGTVESINPNTMSDNQRELCNRQIKQINESIDELMRRRMTSDLRESRLQAMEIEILTTQRRVWEILLEYDTK
jgi:hypothetical protein